MLILKFKKDGFLTQFKGTVSVILSDPPCKNDNARFTTVVLRKLSLQLFGRNCRLKVFNYNYSNVSPVVELRKSLLERNHN